MKTTYFDNNLIDKLKNCYDFKKGCRVIEANRGFIKKRKDGSEIVNYNDDDFPSYIYYGYIFKGCTWERVPHYHDDIEFLTVTSGEMDYVVNGFNIHLKKGETIFVNSNNVHYSAAPNEGVARYVIAVLHPKIICSAPVVEEKAIKPIVSDKSVPFVHFEAKDFDAPVIHKLLVDMEKEAKENEFLITKYFFEIWDVIMHRFTDAYRVHIQRMEDAGNYNSKIKAMMFFIDGHYNERISLSDIASAGGVSQSLCNQIFNRLTEKSPIEYLMYYRCRKVSDLLQTGDMSMTEIAELTGFTGASYMAETFKKFYKMSPRDFKKSLTKKIK